MHLGNGALTPECAAITMGAAAIGLGAAMVAIRRQPLSREKLALAVGLGSLVFAAQAVNVPVLPGTSAHLVGGVLLAWVLGPGLGAWTMATILAVQALVLGDGGLAAIGANVLNMALLPAGCVAVAQRLSTADGRWAHGVCASAAAVSVPLAALLIVGQTALFRSSTELVGWQEFAARMLATHLWIGLAEGGLTLAAVAALAWIGTPQRAFPTAHGTPQRAFPTAPGTPQRAFLPSGACLALALAIAAIAFPWSSRLPDGYEAAAQKAGLSAWLSEGTGALLSLGATFGEHGSLIAATLLVAALFAILVALLAPHRTVSA